MMLEQIHWHDAVAGLISIPMCVYNGETYLAEAIDSVLAQTYPQIEVTLVDDGSTDRSADIARGYGDQVHYIHQSHQGIGAARNCGLAASRGEFIAIQDADDLWVPEKLEFQHQAMMEHPEAGMVGGRIRNFLSPELDPAEFRDVVRADQSFRAQVFAAVLIRRSVFERIGVLPTEGTVGRDTDWFMRYADSGLPVIDLPDLLTYRRIHRNNQGFRERESQRERLRWLKQGLDRRRAAQAARDQGAEP
jgi:glycosyltransferase involved in cell wall biosynthesis